MSDDASSSSSSNGDDDIMSLLRTGISEMEKEKDDKQENDAVSMPVPNPKTSNIVAAHPPKQQELNPELWLGAYVWKTESDADQGQEKGIWKIDDTTNDEEPQLTWKSATGVDSQRKQQLRPKKKQLTPAERQSRMQTMSKAFVKTADSSWNKVKMVTITPDEDSESSSEDDDEAQKVANLKNNQSATNYEKKVFKKNDTPARPQPDSASKKNPRKPVHVSQPSPTRIPTAITGTTMPQISASSNSSSKSIVPSTKEKILPQDLQLTSSLDQLQILQRLRQIGEKHGSEMVMKWIQHQITSNPSSTYSDVSNIGISANMRSSNRQQQFSIRPKPCMQHSSTITSNIETQNSVQVEKQLLQYFRQAVDSVPFQYTYIDSNRNTVSFVVRRPYGMESNIHLWKCMKTTTANSAYVNAYLPNNTKQQVPITPTEAYNRRAHISTLSSLEVMVVMVLNSNNGNTRRLPILILNGVVGVNYRSNLQSPWITIGVRNGETDRDHLHYPVPSLGRFILSPSTVVDLEEILQQAIWVREQYGSTVTSTAMALSKNPSLRMPDHASVNSDAASAATTTTAATRDFGVNTTVTSDQLLLNDEQMGILRRRGRRGGSDCDNEEGYETAKTNKEKELTTTKIRTTKRLILSNSSWFVLFVTFGILLGIWCIRPAAFSDYKD